MFRIKSRFVSENGNPDRIFLHIILWVIFFYKNSSLIQRWIIYVSSRGLFTHNYWSYFCTEKHPLQPTEFLSISRKIYLFLSQNKLSWLKRTFCKRRVNQILFFSYSKLIFFTQLHSVEIKESLRSEETIMCINQHNFNIQLKLRRKEGVVN